MKTNINKLCEREDCRLEGFGVYSVTAMYFPPSYDKDGNNTNPDHNHCSGSGGCSTCGKKFIAHKYVCDQEWTLKEKTDGE